MDSDFENTMASMPQPRNRLENGRSQDDEISRRMWQAVETSTGEIRMGETEGERSKRGSRKKMGEKRKEEEAEEREDNGS